MMQDNDEKDATEDDTAAYGLLVAFPDGSPSFVHGFEAGRIDRRMSQGEQVIEDAFCVHTANLEVFTRLCAHYNYQMEVESTEYPEWAMIKFIRYPRRGGLSIVK